MIRYAINEAIKEINLSLKQIGDIFFKNLLNKLNHISFINNFATLASIFNKPQDNFKPS